MFRKSKLRPSTDSKSKSKPATDEKANPNIPTAGKLRNPKGPRLRGLEKRVLTWLGVLAAVGTLIFAYLALPPRKDTCGQSEFISKEAHEVVSKRPSLWSQSTETITQERLYTPSKEPKDAADVILELSPDLTNLYQALRTGKPFARGKMIFVYGAGGAGKSEILDLLKKGKDTAFIDVGKYFKYTEQTGQVHPDTELKGELTIHGKTISQMPELKEGILSRGLEGLFEVVDKTQKLEASNNVIVDSLDEVHPFSSVKIIDKAMEYVTSTPDKNVILAGRGEAFRDYFEKEGYSARNFVTIHVKPIYVGEEPLLTWYVWQWLRFNYEEGRVKEAPTKETADKLALKLTQLWQSQPALKQFMFTLTPANALINHINDGSATAGFDEFLFSRITERNRLRHYRPMHSDGEVWRLYLDALKQVARVARLRDDGSFVFPVQRTVKVRVGPDCVDVNAPGVLNLSGLIDLEPFDKDQLIYRFFPPSIHTYLAELDSR